MVGSVLDTAHGARSGLVEPPGSARRSRSLAGEAPARTPRPAALGTPSPARLTGLRAGARRMRRLRKAPGRGRRASAAGLEGSRTIRWVRRRLVIVALALGLASPATAGTTHPYEHQTAIPSLAQRILVLLNRVRTEHGLSPLELDPALTRAATQHTSEMLRDGYFGHDSADGASFTTRLTPYTSSSTGRWSVAENLLWASGPLDADRAIAVWMASPEHRANILAPRWRQIGIAVIHADRAPGYYGHHGATVVTTDFGTRS